MLQIGKEYITEIKSLGYEGEGIGKIDGCAIFIPGALTGEQVKVKIVKVKKNYAFGELIKILKRSNDRVDAPCAHSENCGGCALMDINYDNQLKFKYNRVKDCIERIANVNPEIVEPVIGMKNPFLYRNKVQYQVS